MKRQPGAGGMRRAGRIDDAARPARLRGQSGITLIEVLFGTMILGMLATPLVGLTLLTFGTEVGVGDRNEAADAIGMLRSYLQRDVGQAEFIDTSPDPDGPTPFDPPILKCDGGPADNNATRLLTVQHPLEIVDAAAIPPVTRRVQVDYNFSRAVDNSGNTIPGEYSIWRQACNAVDRALIGGASQVIRSVDVPSYTENAASDPVRCVGGSATFVENVCPTVQMKVTPLAEGAIEQTASATSRLTESSGSGTPLDVGDIQLQIIATRTDGNPLTGEEPPGSEAVLSAQFTYPDPVTYVWENIDGAIPTSPGWTSASTGGQFKFNDAGAYRFRLTIYDTANPGHFGSASLRIVIGAEPPVLVVGCGDDLFTYPATKPCELMRGSRGLSTADSKDQFGDPVATSWESVDPNHAGDVPTVHDPTVHVRQNYPNNQSIPWTSPDRLTCDASQCATSAQVLFNEPGSRLVKVTATDSNGLKSSLLLPVNVRTQPPTLTLTAQTTPRVPASGGSVTFKAVANLPARYNPDWYPWAKQILWEIEDANGAIVTPAPDDLGSPLPFPADYASQAQTLSQRTVTRTFNFSGPFPMKLRAYAASDGGEISVAEVFTIRANTDPNPSANFSFVPTASGSNFNIAFTSSSTDDVMPIPIQQWSFAGPFTPSWPTGNGNNFNVTGITPGNHPVKLFVQDAGGRTDEIIRTVPLPGTPAKPTGVSRTTISPTEGSYTWDGVPGADGYEFEITYRNAQHVYVDPETKYVSQPTSAAGATITASLQNTENNCSVANACYKFRMRTYFVIDGVTYASGWTSSVYW